MTSREEEVPEFPALVKLLKEGLGNRNSCPDVISGYEEVMRPTWSFMAQLLGDDGTRAVVERSVKLATAKVPLLAFIKVSEKGVVFSGLQERITEEDCSAPEILDALAMLAVWIFRILSDLTGNSITEPLLIHLKTDKNLWRIPPA